VWEVIASDVLNERALNFVIANASIEPTQKHCELHDGASEQNDVMRGDMWFQHGHIFFTFGSIYRGTAPNGR
jgi:hypothetical protein